MADIDSTINTGITPQLILEKNNNYKNLTASETIPATPADSPAKAPENNPVVANNTSESYSIFSPIKNTYYWLTGKSRVHPN